MKLRKKPKPTELAALSFLLLFAGCAAVSEKEEMEEPPVLIDQDFHCPVLLTPKDSEEYLVARSVSTRLTISVDGAVSNVELLESSGSSRFDAMALRSIKTAKYKPAKSKSGRPIEVTVIQPFLYRCEKTVEN